MFIHTFIITILKRKLLSIMFIKRFNNLFVEMNDVTLFIFTKLSLRGVKYILILNCGLIDLL